ncbi:MAG: flagellar export protein FliJ [Methylophagaceae bacterium]
MKRSKRLDPIVELAIKATEAALVKVAEANAVWSRDSQQLEDLKRYKGEYLARLRSGEQLSMSAQKVLELRGFLAQLDQAIEVQRQQVEVSLTALQHQQVIWKTTRSKEQAMQSLVSRYQQEEMSIELKQEQLDNDERNTSQWLRKSK